MAQSKEPWNNEVYSDENNKDKEPNKTGSTKFLTFLVIGLIAIIGIIIATLLWSNQTVDNSKISSSFYTGPESSIVKPSRTSSENEKEEESDSEDPATEGSTSQESASEIEDSSQTTEDTTVVQAGEGINQIAARTGVPAEQIAAANGMTVATWFAGPGQIVNLR